MIKPCTDVVTKRRKGGGRQGLLMYDFRCTMYDCQIRARCAGRQSRNERNVIKPCTDVVTKRRKGGGRQGLLMYDFRCTMYDCGIRARCAGERSRSERNVIKPRTGVVTKRRWRLTPPMYDVRGTMYDLGSSRACARILRSRGERDMVEQCAERRLVRTLAALVFEHRKLLGDRCFESCLILARKHGAFIA